MREALFAGALGIVVLGLVPGAALPGEVGIRVSAAGGAYTNVTAPALNRMLEDKDFLLVNVHIPYEGEIAKTDAFIPFDRVEQELHRLPTKRDAKMVLYCMSDRMSTIAAEMLVRLGYTNVWNLQGGMVGWRKQGFPLVGASAK